MIAKTIFIALIGLGALATIYSVGKPRKPMDGTTAAIVVAIDAIMILAIAVWWH